MNWPPGGLSADRDWRAFGTCLQEQSSEWLLLPEMPFSPWLASAPVVDPDRWRSSSAIHDHWIRRLAEQPAQVVIGSRPMTDGDRFFNEGFVWQKSSGYRAVHRKYYLSDEAGFWEASGYARGAGDFKAVEIEGLRIGFLICTGLWFGDRARTYGRQGLHLLVCPRATPAAFTDKWIAGGITAAVVSGALCVSSNFNDPNRKDLP